MVFYFKPFCCGPNIVKTTIDVSKSFFDKLKMGDPNPYLDIFMFFFQNNEKGVRKGPLSYEVWLGEPIPWRR